MEIDWCIFCTFMLYELHAMLTTYMLTIELTIMISKTYSSMCWLVDSKISKISYVITVAIQYNCAI